MRTKKYVGQATTSAQAATPGYTEVGAGTVSVPFSAFTKIVHLIPNGNKQKAAIMGTLSNIGAGYAKLNVWFQELGNLPLEA